MKKMPLKQPRTKEKVVRIREIQAAAKKVFFKKGYQNATMQEIADKAKVSKGTVYLYYKGKDDLYVALMMPSLEELGRLFSEVEVRLEREELNGRDFIMELCQVFKEYYNYDPDGVRIYQAFQLGNLFEVLSKETLEKLNSIGMRNYGLARRLFSRAIELGLVEEVDPVQIGDTLWGLLLGIVQIEENKKRWTKKDHVESTLEFGYSLLSRALRVEK
jgi:TetR/AcrR family transcriptional regulator